MKVILVSQLLNVLEDREEIRLSLTRELGVYSYSLRYPAEAKYKIDEIKAFTSSLYKKLTDEDAQTVHVLMHSDGLTDIDQNALLKTLEESKHHIVLVVKNSNSLLPTVRSRCEMRFIENENLKNISSQTPELSLSYGEIPKLAKMERNEVKAMVQQHISTLSVADYDTILILNEALKKLEANCKIESIFFEVVHNLKR